MKLSVFFILLFICLSFAKTDSSYFISNTSFQEQPVLIQEGFCLGTKGGMSISKAPQLPLEANQLYLREKNTSNEYQWIFGEPQINCYQKFNAFDIQKNNLNPDEVPFIRFYSSPLLKPYQDEAEVFFDSKYIYSKRISTLYYKKDEDFLKLERDSLPGFVKINSELEDYTLTKNGVEYPSIRVISPLPIGLFYAKLSAPGYFSTVTATAIVSGKESIIQSEWLAKDSLSQPYSIQLDTSKLSSITTIQELEDIYDAFALELSTWTDSISEEAFQSFYPRPVSYNFLYRDTAEFSKYLEEFDAVKLEEEHIWRNAKLQNFQNFYQSIISKKDSLEALPLRVQIKPDSLRFVLIPKPTKIQEADSNSNEKSTNLQSKREVELVFKDSKSRYDFIWRGNIPSFNEDSLVRFFNQKNPDLKVHLNLSQNKPVWISEGGLVKSRHHYRYKSIEFSYKGAPFLGEGIFILPSYIASTTEVQEWLASQTKVLPLKKEELRPTPFVEEVKIQEPVLEDTLKQEEPDLDSIKGEVVFLDSAVFTFKNKQVSLSPFFINTTEITQEHFERIMKTKKPSEKILVKLSFKDPQKPMHNISWQQSKQFCEIIGGSLPTEAEWEYASRGNHNIEYLWDGDSVPTASDYAIYHHKNQNIKKGDSLYGPQKVKTKKPNLFGIYDIAGNVAEWTLDRYSYFPEIISKINPKGALFGWSRIIKGGSWKSKEKKLHLIKRDYDDPRYWSDDLGFRCVFKPETKGQTKK